MFPIIRSTIAIMDIRSLKTRKDNRSLIDIRTFYLISCKTYNSRAPIATINRHIHQPLPHGWIPNNIRSPLITLDIITSILPVMNIISTKSYFISLVIFYPCYSVRVISISIGYLMTRRISKKCTSICFTTTNTRGPVNQICSL